MQVVTPEPDPCSPSPCKANGQCRVVNGAAACTYPECVINSDCPSDKACYFLKCQNPCAGACGLNAICQVVNHQSVCTCPPGFTGTPEVQCRYVPPERKAVGENVSGLDAMVGVFCRASTSAGMHRRLPVQQRQGVHQHPLPKPLFDSVLWGEFGMSRTTPPSRLHVQRWFCGQRPTRLRRDWVPLRLGLCAGLLLREPRMRGPMLLHLLRPQRPVHSRRQPQGPLLLPGHLQRRPAGAVQQAGVHPR